MKVVGVFETEEGNLVQYDVDVSSNESISYILFKEVRIDFNSRLVGILHPSLTAVRRVESVPINTVCSLHNKKEGRSKVVYQEYHRGRPSRYVEKLVKFINSTGQTAIDTNFVVGYLKVSNLTATAILRRACKYGILRKQRRGWYAVVMPK